MTKDPLTVELGERSYRIHFAKDARESLGRAVGALKAEGRSVALVADASVLAAHPGLPEAAGFEPGEILEVPAGETSKSVEQFDRILRFLAGRAMNRDGAVFALGGGVTGDLAGFAAAAYLRGVDFHQIPTTLLAMVDSSVGGKTGINLPEGKNLVGAFWQPRAVYIVPALLETLPPREFAAGMAEVVKYGLLHDAELFAQLETLPPLAPTSDELPGIIRRCCAIKADIVRADERETATSGGRALLNLGHTFAHAIEQAAGYGEYLHGEAVAVGLVLAARLSAKQDRISPAQVDRARDVLEKYALPVRLRSPLPVDTLMNAMRRDKKVRAGKLRFVVLDTVGSAVTCDDVEPQTVAQLWRDAGAQ